MTCKWHWKKIFIQLYLFMSLVIAKDDHEAKGATITYREYWVWLGLKDGVQEDHDDRGKDMWNL